MTDTSQPRASINAMREARQAALDAQAAMDDAGQDTGAIDAAIADADAILLRGMVDGYMELDAATVLALTAAYGVAATLR